ncbi:MAG TPA: HAD-IA family hydrolase [Burkholderiaceae bacterium]|nr:HAD-IA family hydrolase [Burkholderiaceae bacterium]
MPPSTSKATHVRSATKKAPPLRALIFDVDGTLADSESVHRVAFNHAFREVGLDWNWDLPLYTRLLEISGGRERIHHYWREVRGDVRSLDAGALTDTVQRIHDIKTAEYERMVQDGDVALRPGVLPLVRAAHEAGLRLAIATTTSPVNIGALLRSAIGPDWTLIFPIVEDASTAPIKKPHPQVYLQALKRLGLSAAECLAIEDSANGLKAARAAGLATIVTHNSFTAHHEFDGAARILDSLQDVTIADLRAWHAAAFR